MENENKSLNDIISEYKKSLTRQTMQRLNCIPDVNKREGIIGLFFEMISDYKKNNYKLLSLSTILTLIGALVYVISPVDVIPESIFVVGCLDDLAVIAFALRTCYEEVCAYKLWLATRDLPAKDAIKIIKQTMSDYRDIS